MGLWAAGPRGSKQARRRIPDRVVFEYVIAALVHSSGYERVASDACSGRTIRRRLRRWAEAEAGLGEQLHELALDAYDRMIGLDVADVSADSAITKAPGGGDRTGRFPVDRGTGGMKRSTGVDGYGIPLGITGTSAQPARLAATARHPSPRAVPSCGTTGPSSPTRQPYRCRVEEARGKIAARCGTHVARRSIRSV